MDEKSHMLNDHVASFERNVQMLQQEIQNWIASSVQVENHLRGFEKTLDNIIAQEPFAPLGEAMRTMADSKDKLIDATHEVMCERPEKKLLDMLTEIQSQAIVPIKRLIKDRESCLKQELKLRKEYESISSKSKQAEKKLRALSDQNRRVENVNGLIDYHMKKLEHFRVSRLKKILQELTWCEMYYHCKALETLPPSSKMASLINPNDAVQEIGKTLQTLAH